MISRSYSRSGARALHMATRVATYSAEFAVRSAQGWLLELPPRVQGPTEGTVPELPEGAAWVDGDACEKSGPAHVMVRDDGYGPYIYGDAPGGEFPVPVVLAVLARAGLLGGAK